MAEIIQFPKENKRFPHSSLKNDIQEYNKTGEIDDANTAIYTVNTLCLVLMEQLHNCYIDTNNKEKMKDLALLLESLKSYIFSYYELYYPLQKISKDIFIMRDGVIYLNQKRINKITNIEN